MNLDELRHKINEKFPQSILATSSFRGEDTIILRAEDLLDICRYLHDDPEISFNYLTDLCGVDYFPREPRFEVVYHLCSLKTRCRLRLKVPLPGESPQLASVTSIWQGAEWLEREVYDLLGITFVGHPDLRRILLPPDWQGHPLRKDYPLRG
ncbi:MAG: NADH-quinone oxidoreductase subunit C [Thermodesulfobacteriota bacterium]